MTREEYIKLMEYLQNEKLKKSGVLRHGEVGRHLHYLISMMADGYIRHSRLADEHHPLKEEDDYLTAVHQTLEISTELADEIGMLEILEDYADPIIEGMEFDDLPSVDIEVLKILGETDPRGALLAAYLKTKSRKSLKGSDIEHQPMSIGEKLRFGKGEIKGAQESFREKQKHKDDDTDRPKAHARPSRRWFKGLGKIAQGSALTLANTCLAAGVLVLPVAPSTQTWGSIVSSITGVGIAIDGVGELRGE